MGAYLNKPIVDKNSEEGNNERIRFAATAMQGWRINQEVRFLLFIFLSFSFIIFMVIHDHYLIVIYFHIFFSFLIA